VVENVWEKRTLDFDLQFSKKNKTKYIGTKSLIVTGFFFDGILFFC